MRGSLAAVFLAVAAAVEGATWYVRTDGGLYGTTSTTCNGQTDAAFTGSNGPNCAVKHPFEVIGVQGNNPVAQRIAGGDTVIIKNGSYQMGAGGDYTTGYCNPSWTYDCVMAPIPSGPNSSSKTKIYGEGHASCTTKPELWGSGGAYMILNLTNSSNVDLRCLDVTDHDDCGGNYSTFACPAASTSAVHAGSGLRGHNGSNNEMTNVRLHGLATSGMVLGKQTSLSLTDVDIIGNAFAGLDQDTPNADDSWSGTNTFTRVKINWNGCSENYPVDGTFKGCTDQNNTGYGDGLGSPGGGTSGSYTFTDSEFLFNTSDALDLLYLSDSASVVTVERTRFEGNVGNLIKSGNGNTILRNNAIIANCGYWDGFSSKGPGFTTCRAGGNNVVLVLTGGGLADIVNNTIAGEPDILISLSGCDGGEGVNIKNNVLIGTTQYGGGGDTTSWEFSYNGCTGSEITASNNVIYGVKESTPCSSPVSQTNCTTSNPNVVSANFTTETFDLRLQSGSPAIDLGLDSGTVVGQTTVPTVDFNSASRAAADVDAGAYEFSSAIPIMATCSLAQGTVGVAYDQTISVSGGTTPYTACDETSGSLPAGSPAFTSTATSSGCRIQGTPTTAGTSNFTERVTDSGSQTDSEACTLVIAASLPNITTTTLPGGVVGFPYSAQIAVTGGTTPYTACDEVSGALPAGSPVFTSTANAGGCIIEGTPTTVGTSNFTERVTDSGSQTDDQALSIVVSSSSGTITAAVNPGSAALAVRYGFPGLPEDADCNVVVKQGGTQVGSALSASGAATRQVVVAGLSPSTTYTATASCDVPSAPVDVTVTTFPASSGSQTVTFNFGAPSSVLSGAARVTVDCDDDAAFGSPTSVQNTSCGSGCTVNHSLSAGVYYCRHRWQTAADAVLATSATQPIPVP